MKWNVLIRLSTCLDVRKSGMGATVLIGKLNVFRLPFVRKLILGLLVPSIRLATASRQLTLFTAGMAKQDKSLMWSTARSTVNWFM